MCMNSNMFYLSYKQFNFDNIYISFYFIFFFPLRIQGPFKVVLVRSTKNVMFLRYDAEPGFYRNQFTFYQLLKLFIFWNIAVVNYNYRDFKIVLEISTEQYIN